MGPLIFMVVPRGKFHAESIWLGAVDAQCSHHPQNGDLKMAAVANLKIHNIKQKNDRDDFNGLNSLYDHP